MRRFEFVEGTSAKFWMADVEGSTFVVVYGRLGTAGQRKDKAFPDEAAARRELEKKIAEKLREGYHEVAADAAASAPTGAKGAAAAAPRLELPARLRPAQPTPDAVRRATDALVALESEVGSRSWAVAHRARRARRALEALGGFDPARDPAMNTVFASLMSLVTAPRGARRLPLRLAMELLSAVDAAAFARAVDAWRKAPSSAPAAAAVGAIAKQLDALENPELALRVAALLAERPEVGPGVDAGWQRRWRALAPHLEGYLVTKGAKLRDHVRAIDRGDPWITRRADAMGGA